MVKTYNRFTFFKHTFCEWTAVDKAPEGKPDYTSKSGSSYYFTQQGVYRLANHWGRAANCRWRLRSPNKTSQFFVVGYANWSDFHPNNDTDPLYYISVDYLGKSCTYQHRALDSAQENKYRSAVATVKRIQLINQVLQQDSWAKYLPYQDIQELRVYIVERLLHTNESLLEIKRSWNNG